MIGGPSVSAAAMMGGSSPSATSGLDPRSMMLMASVLQGVGAGLRGYDPMNPYAGMGAALQGASNLPGKAAFAEIAGDISIEDTLDRIKGEMDLEAKERDRYDRKAQEDIANMPEPPDPDLLRGRGAEAPLPQSSIENAAGILRGLRSSDPAGAAGGNAPVTLSAMAINGGRGRSLDALFREMTGRPLTNLPKALHGWPRRA